MMNSDHVPFDPHHDDSDFEKWLLKDEHDRIMAQKAKGPAVPPMPAGFRRGVTVKLRFVGRPARAEVISQSDVDRVKKIKDPREVEYL